MPQQLKTFLMSLKGRASFAGRSSVQKTVEKIINDVKRDGDSAVRKYSLKFDSVSIKSISIGRREIDASAKKAGKKFLKALQLSAKRIRVFHELQKEESWYFSEKNGILLGQSGLSRGSACMFREALHRIHRPCS
jgi:histidinol dehydrogenase